MRVGSLFSGIGGVELGLERAGGFSPAWFVEWEPFCQEVIKKAWPGVPVYGDITTIAWETMPSVDVLTGGFPCQDISVAGRNAGIKEGTRSGLWLEYAKGISILKPRFVIIENVAQLLTRGLATVVSELERLGYCPHAKIIEASDFGAPHRRQRLFIIAHTSQERCDDCLDFNAFYEVHHDERWNVAEGGEEWRQLAFRISENVRSGNWSADAARAARVDDGVPCWVDRVAACGNAVVPQIAEAIGKTIKR